MPWRSVRGHDRQVAELRQTAALGRLPHAFLFVGPDGVGKRLFARTLAEALLCEQMPEQALDACGTCPSCLQVQAGTHPDLVVVQKPEDKHDLPIKVIRDLCVELGLKPMRGSRRVAIVQDADDLNDESSNAFLKTLEEPPPNSVLILIGTSAELQLDTIVSRCRVLRFDPLAEADLAAVLREQGVAQPEEAARLGEGSVQRALGLADPEFQSFRRGLIDELANPRGFDSTSLSRRLEEFAKAAGKESVAQRDRASLLMGELTRLFRDVLWQTSGLTPPSPDAADRQAVSNLANRLEPEDVFVLADRCLEAGYHIQRKVYMPLILDSLMSDLRRVLRPGAGS